MDKPMRRTVRIGLLAGAVVAVAGALALAAFVAMLWSVFQLLMLPF